MNRAPFLKRLAAAVIDVIAIVLLAAGLEKLAVLSANMQSLGHDTMGSVEVWLMLIVVPPLAVLAYTSTEIFWSVTLGKKIMKLRIGDIQGRRAKTSRLLFRWSLKNVALLANILWTFYFTAVTLHTQAVPNWLANLASIAIDIVTSLLVLTTLSFLLAARTNRQSFYDWLTGTAVYSAAAITEQPAFKPVMSDNA